MLIRILQAILFFYGLFILPATACSINNHSCQFHGMGRAVNPNISPDSPTAVYIVTEGSTSTDFDNNVLLPDKLAPYVISNTGYPTRNDQPYIGTTEQSRHVYPGQYQIDFNNNTAQATHSGDFNGLEAVPSATGCQYSTATYCEEVKILGNIPDPQDGVGFVVKQTNHLYNAQNVADPSNELQSYAVATGSAFIRTFGHQAIYDEQTHSGYNYDSLKTTGQLGEENTYYIGYYGFEPHAIGVPVHYNENWNTYSTAYETQIQHQIYRWQDLIQHSQQRFVSGVGDTWTANYSFSTTPNIMSVTTIPEHLRDIYDSINSMVDAKTGLPNSLTENLKISEEYYDKEIASFKTELMNNHVEPFQLNNQLDQSKQQSKKFGNLGDFVNNAIISFLGVETAYSPATYDDTSFDDFNTVAGDIGTFSAGFIGIGKFNRLDFLYEGSSDYAKRNIDELGLTNNVTIGRAPEFFGGRVNETGFLNSAENFLGPNYSSFSNGRYISADGMRQIRYGNHEVYGPIHHGHFEAYNMKGGKVIENTWVKIISD